MRVIKNIFILVVLAAVVLPVALAGNKAAKKLIKKTWRKMADGGDVRVI